MVKTYLRYAPSAQLGVITSPNAAISVDPAGNYVFTGELEQVGVISVKRGVQLLTLAASGTDASATSEVTVTAASPNGRQVAAGYADGMIRVFDHMKGSLAVVLNGHKKAVTSLAFSSDGTQLASGARDTDVIVWDVVSESGLCRLRGHKDEITEVAFLDAAAEAGDPAARGGLHRYVVSASKDTLLKVWDIGGGGHGAACVQTIVGARSEVWSIAVCPSLAAAQPGSSSSSSPAAGDRLLAGAGDNQLRVWAVGKRPVAGAAASATVSASNSADSVANSGGNNSSNSSAATSVGTTVLVAIGSITRQATDRVGRVRLSPDGRYAALQGGGNSKMVELYRRRDAGETRKRVQRRLKRHREKLAKKEKERASKAAKAASLGLDDHSSSSSSSALALGAGLEDAADLESEGLGFLAGTTLADLDAALERIEADAKREIEGGSASSASSSSSSAADTARWIIASDEWELVGITQTGSKITSCAVLPAAAAGGGDGSVQLLVATADNQLLHFAQPVTTEAAKAAGSTDITLANGTVVHSGVLRRSIASAAGHRSDVRAVAVSSDGSLVLSSTTGSAKVWNAKTGACVRTLDLEVPVTSSSAGDDEDADDGAVPMAPSAPGAGASVGLCAAFAPGNRHALVGTRDGRLLLFDLASGDLLESHAAHTGPVWSMSVRPDGKGIVTGSADKDVKFWDFDLRPAVSAAPAAPASSGKKGGKKDAPAPAPAPAAAAGPMQLTLVHSRTLKMTDEVLVVKHSASKDPSKLLLAVALLDCTVKVFFEDSLKFALSLYGHKLPVMAMDVSADSTLLVTASADKSVKLWGLDFGDCHHSFLAHGDSVMSVGFVASTHYFWTGGKDRAVKYWDGDRFLGIAALEGWHKGEVWSLAVAPDGSFFATGGHDRSVRLWRRTEEQIFLEEEAERAFDALLEKQLRDPDGEEILAGKDAVGPLGADGVAVVRSGDDDAVPVVAAPLDGSGSGLPEASTVIAHATRDTVKGTDRLLEALTLACDEADKWTEYAQDVAAAQANGDGEAADSLTPPPRNPLLLGLTPSAYLLRTLRSIRPSDIDQVLLVLPFADALRLLRYLHHLLVKRQGVELASRCALLLLRVHHAQIVANASSHTPLMVSLRHAMHAALGEHKDTVGFNVAGLRLLERSLTSAGVGEGEMFGPRRDKEGKKGGRGGIRVGKRQKVNLF